MDGSGIYAHNSGHTYVTMYILVSESKIRIRGMLWDTFTEEVELFSLVGSLRHNFQRGNL